MLYPNNKVKGAFRRGVSTHLQESNQIGILGRLAVITTISLSLARIEGTGFVLDLAYVKNLFTFYF